jgi:hypothetical protein
VSGLVLVREPVDDGLEDEREAGRVAARDGGRHDPHLRLGRRGMVGPEREEQLARVGARGERGARAPAGQEGRDAAALGVCIPLRLERHRHRGRAARPVGEHRRPVLGVDQDTGRRRGERGHDLGLERADLGSLGRCDTAALERDGERVAVIHGHEREDAVRADPVQPPAPTEVGGAAHSPRSAR